MIVVLSRRILFITAMAALLVVPLSHGARADAISIGELSKIYEPLKFTHDKHMEIEANCSSCHHYSGQETPNCRTCHNAGGDESSKKKNIVGLQDAYHGLCIGCHKKISGPSTCSGCHKKKDRKLDTLNLGTISKRFTPVQFSHGRHIDTLNDCALCHHNSKRNLTPACTSCHEAAPIYKYAGPDRKTGLGLKGAYHGLCVGCHKKTSGPAGCTDCHLKKAVKQ